MRGTIESQGNAVEVAFDSPVGKKRIDLQEIPLEKAKPGWQSSQTMAGSTQTPSQVRPISQTNPSNKPESNPSDMTAQMPKQKFLAGDYIKHPIYGVERVVSDGNTVVEVDGGKTGTKTIFPEVVNLEKVQGTSLSPTNMVHQGASPKGTLSLTAFLREKGLTIIDNRPLSEALWVVGGSELTPLM